MQQTQTAKPTDKKRTASAVLYDVLMAEIEPELTSVMIPELESMYAWETPEEAKEREERYKKAFQKFSLLWQALLDAQQEYLQQLQKRTMRQFEKDTEEQEADMLHTLEKTFHTQP